MKTLRPVVDPVEATEGSLPPIHDELGGNVAMRLRRGSGDFDTACNQATGVARQRYRLQRISAAPMEGRAVLASYEASDDQLTFWTSTQVPHVVRFHLAEALGSSLPLVIASFRSSASKIPTWRLRTSSLVLGLLSRRRTREAAVT